MHVRDVLN